MIKNWWLNPEGKLIDSGASHIQWARKYIVDNNLESEAYDDMYDSEILHSWGWIRVKVKLKENPELSFLGNCTAPRVIMRNTMDPAMNVEQLKTAKRLCKEYNYDFLDSINK